MLEKSKAEQLYEELSQNINEMSAGQRLMSVRRIMQKYSVSQFTVDQALNKLEVMGKVYREPGKGIFVRDLNAVGTKRIGFVVPDWPSQVFMELEEMLKLEASKHGALVSRYSYPACSDISSFLPVKEFDALAVIPDATELSPEALHKFNSASVPVVLVSVPLHDVQMNWVSGDPLANGAMAASYLVKHGHRKLAILVSEPHSSVIGRRIEGFKMIADISGCEVEIIDCDVQSGQYSPEVANKVLTQCIENREVNFTGLFVVSDETALAAMRALIDHGIRIPDDVSVIGSDGLRQGAYFHPPLTSVATDYRDLADEIISCAIDACSNRKQVSGKLVKPHVVERKSVKFLNS